MHLTGVLAEIPFVVPPFFVGPVATAMSQVDIAFIVGLLVSDLVYVGVTRSLDVSRELELINSRPELAGGPPRS
jgi:NCS1 family nucleobase:cation symporter-1